MKELNLSTHKVRRSSFSNTLSELPEVEEPSLDAVSPIPGRQEEKPSNYYALPPIPDGLSLEPEPRSRIHSMPTTVKTTYRHKLDSERSLRGESTPTKCITIEIQHSQNAIPHFKRFEASLSQPYVKSEISKTGGRRRWSIGAPLSHAHDTNSSGGYISKPCDNTKLTKINTQIDTPHSVGKDTPKSEMFLFSNQGKIPMRFSVSEAVTKEEKPKDFTSIQQADRLRNRRWSNPLFAETAKKVNILLKIGQLRKSKIADMDGQTDTTKSVKTLADLAVEMPKNPRFSALMSPEAQYSIMMGYEDKLHDKLVKKYPQYQPILKRNKTPVQKVNIRRKNSICLVDDEEAEGEDIVSDEEVSYQNGSTRSSFITQTTDPDTSPGSSNFLGFNQLSGSTQSLDTTVSDLTERPDSRTALRSLRRLSVSLEKKHYLNRLFDSVDDEDMEGTCVRIHRSCSLPNVNTDSLPLTRRLMMTHRMESAMDILDAIKDQGEFHLSPRLKSRKSIPLSDYNSWVHEWNREFSVQQGNHI